MALFKNIRAAVSRRVFPDRARFAAPLGEEKAAHRAALVDFLLVDYAHHLDLIRIAHDDAKLILHRDPELLSDRGKALRLLLSLFDYDSALVTLRDI